MRFLPFVIGILFVQLVAPEEYKCPEHDVDFTGNDLSSVHTHNWHKCGVICEDTSDCKFWTYDKDYDDKAGTCFLKYSDEGLKELPGTISGAKGCPPKHPTTTTTTTTRIVL